MGVFGTLLRKTAPPAEKKVTKNLEAFTSMDVKFDSKGKEEKVSFGRVN